MTRSRQTADWGSRAGLAKVIPSSVAVGSGTGSADSLGTVTFSGCSSVSLNNVFSSSYRNYRVIIDFDMSANPADINGRLRASGTDASGANTYKRQNIDVNGTSISAFRSSDTYTLLGGGSSNGTNYLAIEFVRPFLADSTGITVFNERSQNDPFLMLLASYHTVDSSYDGFTFYTSSGTTSGTVSVYGYN